MSITRFGKGVGNVNNGKGKSNDDIITWSGFYLSFIDYPHQWIVHVCSVEDVGNPFAHLIWLIIQSLVRIWHVLCTLVCTYVFTIYLNLRRMHALTFSNFTQFDLNKLTCRLSWHSTKGHSTFSKILKLSGATWHPVFAKDWADCDIGITWSDTCGNLTRVSTPFWTMWRDRRYAGTNTYVHPYIYMKAFKIRWNEDTYPMSWLWQIISAS